MSEIFKYCAFFKSLKKVHNFLRKPNPSIINGVSVYKGIDCSKLSNNYKKSG